MPLLDQKAPAEAKAYALALADARLRLSRRSISPAANSCSTSFSVADAYLYTVLNWSRATPIDLANGPAIKAYCRTCASGRASRRRSARKLALYKAEQEAAQGGVTNPQIRSCKAPHVTLNVPAFPSPAKRGEGAEVHKDRGGRGGAYFQRKPSPGSRYALATLSRSRGRGEAARARHIDSLASWSGRPDPPSWRCAAASGSAARGRPR